MQSRHSYKLGWRSTTLLIIFFFLVNDVSSIYTNVKFINLILFIIWSLLVFYKKYSESITLLFLVLICSRTVSSQHVLDVANSEVFTPLTFNIIPGVPIAFLMSVTLILYFLLKIKLKVKFVISALLMLALFTLNTIIYLPENPNSISFKWFIKFITYISVGAMSALALNNFYLDRASSFLVFKESLSCGLIVLATGVIVSLPWNYLHGSEYLFELNTKPILFMALHQLTGNFIFLQAVNLFTTSRGDIILVFIAAGLFVFTKKKFPAKLFIVASISLGLILVLVTYTVPFLVDFLLWKLSEIEFFGGERSGSSVVRSTELTNILCYGGKDFWRLIFGSGIYGDYYFDCVQLPVGIVLDEKSFSLVELQTMSLITTHNFISTLILRFGLISLLFILVLMSYPFIVERNYYFPKLGLVIVFLFNLYYFHSQSYAQFIFGFLSVVILVGGGRNENHVNNSNL